jgi:hypothetical protein
LTRQRLDLVLTTGLFLDTKPINCLSLALLKRSTARAATNHLCGHHP